MSYDVWQTCALVNIGLTRSECASWVQAWGSVVAICAAIGVAWWQANRSEKVAAEARRLAERSRLISIEYLLRRAQEAIVVAQRTLEDNEIAHLRWVSRELSDAMEMLDRMPILDVPAPDLLRHVRQTHQALAHTAVIVSTVADSKSELIEQERLGALDIIIGRLAVVGKAQAECAERVAQWTVPSDTRTPRQAEN